MNRQTVAAAIAAILVLPTLISTASAQEWRDRERFERHAQWERHERMERHFAQRDWDRWHRGRWVHAYRGGREGWYWVVGDAWYFYPRPVYPYPDPYALPVIVAPAPAPTVVVPAPAAQQQCREYQGDAIINGSNQPFYGTACLEPDGQWHIVSSR